MQIELLFQSCPIGYGEKEKKMNGNMFKAEIERVFKEARKTCPNIKDDMLDNNGAIYYANANDGTSFDWSCNKWDKSINELNWDIDTDDCYCYGID